MAPLPAEAAPAGAARKGPSPRGALLRSLLVPGWGQLATGHPWKAALFLGGAAGLATGMTVETGRANEETRKANAAALIGDDAAYDTHVALREKYLSRKDSCVSWLLFLWLYNAMDAYVEANFIDFDEFRVSGLAVPAGGEGGAPWVGVRVSW